VGEVGTDADRLARLVEALGHHVAVLEALSARLPEAADDGIDRAIEASQKAVDKIGKTKHERAGEPTAKPGKTENPGATERPGRTPRGGPTDAP
jgi:hypothetical protein